MGIKKEIVSWVSGWEACGGGGGLALLSVLLSHLQLKEEGGTAALLQMWKHKMETKLLINRSN